MLLEAAPDDLEEPDHVRRLMRDLREVRMSKLRAGVDVLDAGGGVKMNGVGGMEVAEGRAFIGGVIDGLRYEASIYCLRAAKTRLTKRAEESMHLESKLEEKAKPKIVLMAIAAMQTIRTMTWTYELSNCISNPLQGPG